MSVFDSKDFKALRDDWYSKLKDDGFEDIENTKSPREFLKKWDGHYFKCRRAQDRQVPILDYLSKATDFLFEHAFKNEIDKRIWEQHCEGFSVRETSKELKITEWKTWTTLSKLKKIAGQTSE